ncbi:ester cyclase [Pseudonocardia endophytica]|uniref:SnoaL-like polyketide cyclase n=1 Tax=Pseudonocardia endophytica TaxID=401976 RepID=A0A4R1HZU1_PSEEN|nr:ester cyclase [Pseudonocardia endophytica]TCK26755.1 SnoaL-like polyketide cyclase [Pseudonocardia endophytica]
MTVPDGRPPAAEFWAGLADRDVAAAFSVVADDAEVTIIPAGVVGTSDAGRRFFEDTVSAFPDVEFFVKNSFTGTDGVTVTEVSMEGTQAGDYLGVINQEKHIDVDQVWLVHDDGNQVRSITGYWCQNQLYRRLAVKRLDQVAII